MKKLIATLTLAIMIVMLCFAATGCGGKDNADGDNKTNTNDSTDNNNGGNNDGGSNDGGNQQTGSVIASLTATQPSTTLKLGESILITNFYEIKGTSTLSAAQRTCTYESSDPEIVVIKGKRAEALSAGTVTITVTSSVDNTKVCSFEVVVAGVFIDRELTMIPSEDDFSNEWDDATKTGSFRTNSGITNFYYIANVHSTKWYVETEITLHSVNWDDRWPKIGIIAAGENSTGVETMVAFYLNASIGLNDTYDEAGTLIKAEDNNVWNEFGVCELAQGNHWAWEPGITNSLARHHDYAWNTGDATITFGTTFKLGVARDGMDFHVYVNGNYVGSYQLSSELDILYENGQPIASYVGFYQFSSDVTFSNYSATTDEAAVAAKVPESPVYTDFMED